jgi:hypothetical protein
MENETEVSPTSGGVRAKTGKHKDMLRSKVSNGTAFLPGDIDGRSAWIRRAKDIVADLVADMGGEDNTSTAERSLVRRAAVMTVELEQLEKRFAATGSATQIDLDLYIRASGNLRRLLEAIGIQRRPKNITPSLSEYLSNQDAVDADTN